MLGLKILHSFLCLAVWDVVKEKNLFYFSFLLMFMYKISKRLML